MIESGLRLLHTTHHSCTPTLCTTSTRSSAASSAHQVQVADFETKLGEPQGARTFKRSCHNCCSCPTGTLSSTCHASVGLLRRAAAASSVSSCCQLHRTHCSPSISLQACETIRQPKSQCQHADVGMLTCLLHSC